MKQFLREKLWLTDDTQEALATVTNKITEIDNLRDYMTRLQIDISNCPMGKQTEK